MATQYESVNIGGFRCKGITGQQGNEKMSDAIVRVHHVGDWTHLQMGPVRNTEPPPRLVKPALAALHAVGGKWSKNLSLDAPGGVNTYIVPNKTLSLEDVLRILQAKTSPLQSREAKRANRLDSAKQRALAMFWQNVPEPVEVPAELKPKTKRVTVETKTVAVNDLTEQLNTMRQQLAELTAMMNGNGRPEPKPVVATVVEDEDDLPYYDVDEWPETAEEAEPVIPTATELARWDYTKVRQYCKDNGFKYPSTGGKVSKAEFVLWAITEGKVSN